MKILFRRFLRAQRCSKVPMGQCPACAEEDLARMAWAHISSLFLALKTWCSTWANPSSSLEQGEWFCQQGPGPLTLSWAALVSSVPRPSCAKWPPSQLARLGLAASSRQAHSQLLWLVWIRQKCEGDHTEPFARSWRTHTWGSWAQSADPRCGLNALPSIEKGLGKVAIFGR